MSRDLGTICKHVHEHKKTPFPYVIEEFGCRPESYVQSFKPHHWQSPSFIWQTSWGKLPFCPLCPIWKESQSETQPHAVWPSSYTYIPSQAKVLHSEVSLQRAFKTLGYTLGVLSFSTPRFPPAVPGFLSCEMVPHLHWYTWPLPKSWWGRWGWNSPVLPLECTAPGKWIKA